MEIQRSSRKVSLFLIACFFVLIIFVLWVFTLKEPSGNYYAYVIQESGALTIFNKEVADAYSTECACEIKPSGIYVITEERKLAPPVQGGLKMLASGLFRGEWGRVEVGAKGIRVGMKHCPIGIPILIILSMLVLGLLVFRTVRSRVGARNRSA